METYLVTGATQGLGRATAAALAADRSRRVVLAVRDLPRGRAVAAQLGPNVDVVELDLASLCGVRRFAEEWDRPLKALVNNAGVQLTGATRRTGEGFEETIAVNHLAAMELTIGLLPHLEGGRVLFIGSGQPQRDRLRVSWRPLHVDRGACPRRGRRSGREAACARSLCDVEVPQHGLRRGDGPAP